MKIYLLKPRKDVLDREKDNPWEPWYDKAFGFVVRAESAKTARVIANIRAGGENDGNFLGPWLDAKYSTCRPLSLKGKAKVIIRDFNAA